MPGRRRLNAAVAILALALLPCGASASGTAVPAQAPVLQVAGNDFPELVVRNAIAGADGEPQPLACERIRGRRIDELDPLWKQAVERIHLDCDDLTEAEDGFDMVATVVVGFLKPGTVQFAGVPVAEIRMMDSELWEDHQYLLDRPYAQVRDTVRAFVESRCQAQRENTGALVEAGCTWTEDAQGLYLGTGELGGIWLHPAQDDPLRTVYAEAWSD